jgi:hypothetical protein
VQDLMVVEHGRGAGATAARGGGSAGAASSAR